MRDQKPLHVSPTPKKFAYRKRIESFKYAAEGLRHLILKEPNARIHVVAAALAILSGWYLDISQGEWLAIILCIGMVLTMEIINTAIENICDYISPEYHDKIKVIKDLAAAAVLVSAVMSAVVAGCIFVPKLLALC